MSSARGIRAAHQAFAQLEAEWDPTNPSEGVALDLMGAAASRASKSETAIEATRWLVASDRLSPLARKIAFNYLGVRVESNREPRSVNEIRGGIALLRRRLASDPRNAIALAESARLYTMIGQTEKAGQLLDRALLLFPNDRYLLRSTSRFLVHIGDRRGAHKLLESRTRTREDPWLLASEISIANLSGRRSDNIRIAREMLQRGRWAPHELSELAGALGTLELEADKGKIARKLFDQSIQSPNENSLAQAEWAAAGLKPDFAEKLAAITSSFVHDEAGARKADRLGDNEQALKNAHGWIEDQPFSTEAAVFGSSQASVLGDFESCLDIVDFGLLANPDSAKLTNNRAFALAKLDRVAEASEAMARINEDQYPVEMQAVFTATQGLIDFRMGRVESGIQKYVTSIDKSSTPEQSRIALVLLAVEISRTDSPLASRIVEEARIAAKKLPDRYRLWATHLPRVTD